MLARLLNRIDDKKAGYGSIRSTPTATRRCRHICSNGRGACEPTDETAARLLGVTPQAVSGMVTRYRLRAEGNTRARRLSRESVEAIGRRRGHGRGIGTTNDWLQAARQFCRWLVDRGRLPRDLLARLKPLNARLDVRRRRAN